MAFSVHDLYGKTATPGFIGDRWKQAAFDVMALT